MAMCVLGIKVSWNNTTNADVSQVWPRAKISQGFIKFRILGFRLLNPKLWGCDSTVVFLVAP